MAVLEICNLSGIGHIMIRVGMGYDVHQLVEGRELWLGGVKILFERGLLGHSDADVLLHAVCDALLGAANMRDIGYHFPDTKEEFHGIDSKVLLRRTVEIIAAKGYRVGNIDATILAQAPKMRPHIDTMRENIAASLGIPVKDVNVKATTEEGLGFTGKGEGIAAHAVCIIE